MKKLLGLLVFGVSAFASWMDEQIAADLALFPKKSLSLTDLRAALKNPRIGNWHAELALIEICGARVRLLEGIFTGRPFIQQRLAKVLEEISRWQREAPPEKRLPNATLLWSFDDGLDVAMCEGYVFPQELQVPLFVFCKRASSNKLVLIPDPGALSGRVDVVRSLESGITDFPWEKKREVLFWRGSATDGEYTLDTWKSRPRAKLALLSVAKPDIIDAGLTHLIEVKAPEVMDALLSQLGEIKKILSIHDHMAYKYLMDIDGNSNGWDRCFWGLLSNSALFKQASDFTQWYYKALEPGRHYIPVKSDLSDLEEQIAWAKNHDAAAHKIALQGRELAEEVFRRDAVFAYMRDLLMAYNERFKN